jgi:hypothetical protein
MVIVLALDIDDTLFDSRETQEVLWIYDKSFWENLIENISKTIKGEGLEFRVALVTAKSKPDELVYHALHTFSEYIDLGVEKPCLDESSSLPITFYYQDYEGKTNPVKLTSKGVLSSVNDMKEEHVKTGVFILSAKERYEFICSENNTAADSSSAASSPGFNDERILAMDHTTIEKIKSENGDHLLTKAHALKSLAEMYGIPLEESREAVILLDDRWCNINDANGYGFSNVRVGKDREKEETRTEIMACINKAISSYKEKDLYSEINRMYSKEWENSETDTDSDSSEENCFTFFRAPCPKDTEESDSTTSEEEGDTQTLSR